MKIHLVLIALISSSCASNTGTGAIAAGALGGTIGGISSGKNGGLIGAAAGVVVGGLVGTLLDQQDRVAIQKNSPRTLDRIDRTAPLTINDVIKLSQSGISDDTIVSYIETSLSFYKLTQTQIRRLENSGVSAKVIQTMIQSTQ